MYNYFFSYTNKFGEFRGLKKNRNERKFCFMVAKNLEGYVLCDVPTYLKVLFLLFQYFVKSLLLFCLGWLTIRTIKRRKANICFVEWCLQSFLRCWLGLLYIFCAGLLWGLHIFRAHDGAAHGILCYQRMWVIRPFVSNFIPLWVISSLCE